MRLVYGRDDATLAGSPVADGTGGTVMKEDPGPVGLLGGFHKVRTRARMADFADGKH